MQRWALLFTLLTLLDSSSSSSGPSIYEDIDPYDSYAYASSNLNVDDDANGDSFAGGMHGVSIDLTCPYYFSNITLLTSLLAQPIC